MPDPSLKQARSLYRALVTKDARLDGRIYFGVSTTGIYCRPICPARTPRFGNVRFFLTSAAAEEAGFRPCRRCRPETCPGSPAWVGTSTTVTRALRCLHAGAPDETDCDRLAARLGISERHLRRLFLKHLGASPGGLRLTRRLDFACKLVDETPLPFSEIAFAAGFESIRRFNDAFRKRFHQSPTEARKRMKPRDTESGLTLKLGYRPPYDWKSVLGFLEARTLAGVEWVDGGVYSRTVLIEDEPGLIELRPLAESHQVEVRIQTTKVQRLLEITQRVSRLLDLEADPLTIAKTLARGKILQPALKAFPGMRVPGAWDGFEHAVRAVLGQQISVAGARTLACRLVERLGPEVHFAGFPRLNRLFPAPATVARADLGGLGITGSRIRSIQVLAERIAEGRLVLSPSSPLDETRARLLEIPGIGPWTVEAIAMRSLRDPDAFPASDLGIKRVLDGHSQARVTESWRPWRAYATLYLWKTGEMRVASTKPRKGKK